MANVLEFYFKAQTQWVYVGGMSVEPVGLNYLAVIELSKIYKFKLNDWRMDLLRMIESFMLKEMKNGKQ